MTKTYAKASKKLTVPKYFEKPKNTSCWYVRLTPPKHVQHVAGTRPYRVTTGQSDLKKAKSIGLTMIGAKLSEWDRLAEQNSPSTAKPVILTSALIDGICSARLYSWMKSDEEHRADGLPDDELQSIEEYCRHSDTAMRASLAQGPASAHWPSLAKSVLEWSVDMGYELSPQDALMPTLMRQFAQVERKASEGISMRNKGDTYETPRAPADSHFITLSAITNIYLTHKAVDGNSKHINTILNAWRLFIAHVGDVHFDSVKPSHVFDFMSARMNAEDKPWSEARTKNFGKRALREIFGLARTKGMMNAPNPVDGLEVFPSLSKADEESRKRPRFPFTNVQLNAIFASAWYDPNESQQIRGKLRTDLGARYWIPLLGLCHGNRVREAAQLVVSDFSRRTGLLVLTFRIEIDSADDEKGKNKAEPVKSSEVAAIDSVESLRSLKNVSANRTVPVHPLLLELGFDEFIEARRQESGNQALLFPSSQPEAGGDSPKLGRAYEQAFLRFVRDRLAFGNGFGNHSFRHQLEDRIRHVQSKSGLWPAGMGQQYSGRKITRPVDRNVLLTEGSEDRYGSGYTPDAMLPYISRLDFSAISTPVPYFQWLKGSPEAGP
ncbi:hypothetical protein LNV09_14405 [Paucibacter sp. B2R-40]|uniref:hypothetical protein n=1 Tax=Paucibacter sp. B2R-40 TaxID=2893554 RepID=UPI0021E4C86F|nr:hypothetical protein [Paucibacter sp. B2R-40]MCV2355342.1 hypothetical protein [Paucibacter sp. B2R-40]